MLLRKSAPSTLWILSFGDLVTLLLCFFISLLAGTMRSKGMLGTTLAVSPSNPVRAEAGQTLRLKPEWFVNDGGNIQPDQRKVLEGGINSWIEKGGKITVRGCLGVEDAARSDAWLVSTSRVLTVTRQLLDTGIRRERITAEPVSQCEPGVQIDFEAAQ